MMLGNLGAGIKSTAIEYYEMNNYPGWHPCREISYVIGVPHVSTHTAPIRYLLVKRWLLASRREEEAIVAYVTRLDGACSLSW